MSVAEKTLNVAFIGAGAINFGGAEGPWDHASRLEKLGCVRIVAIVDPDLPKAQQVLRTRQTTQAGLLYKDCTVHATTDDFLSSGIRCDAALLGVPPAYRGSTSGGKNLEEKLLAAGIHVFVEKPLSVEPWEDFRLYQKRVAAAQTATTTVLSVAYMFRYHAAILKMKELIADHGGQVMAFNGRYYNAYSEMDHAFWWDKQRSGGPIVEQATHFCDLARFLVGEVNMSSVRAECLRDRGPNTPGHLSSIPAGCEETIALEKRIPRVTMATWRFESGAVGSLMHAVAMHGKVYDTYLEVLLDGLRLTLHQPYTPDCRLLVRDGRSGSDVERAYSYGDDDPYERELRVFLDAVKSGQTQGIASPHDDAAQTYKFTWAIRNASESGK